MEGHLEEHRDGEVGGVAGEQVEGELRGEALHMWPLLHHLRLGDVADEYRHQGGLGRSSALHLEPGEPLEGSPEPQLLQQRHSAGSGELSHLLLVDGGGGNQLLEEGGEKGNSRLGHRLATPQSQKCKKK